MQFTNIKNTHFWILLAGSVAFCLWLVFGLGSDLRTLLTPFDAGEAGRQSMALNFQTANTLAIQDVRSAVTGLAGYVAFVVVVISHRYLWERCVK